ncbi:hypothetical protein ACWGKW_18310 [Streptomyces sp. NPDC054766]
MPPRSSKRPSGPFPYLDTPEWRAKFVQAGVADARCHLDEAALKRLSTELINAKSLIKIQGKGTEAVVVGFKDNVVHPVVTEHGTLFQLEAKQAGLAGAINQFNIRFAHDVAASAEIPTPNVQSAAAPSGTVSAAVVARFDSENELQAHLTFIEGRLASAEQQRPYDLKADLEASGQSERVTYHLIRYVVGDQSWYSVAATAGSNRTRHRHDLFGLQPAVGILGLGQSTLGGSEGMRWRNPADWRDRYTSKLNTFHDVDPHDLDEAEDNSDAELWVERAEKALQVAITDAAFVIGYAPAENVHADFDAALASTNLRTHLRGPLEFSDTNQAMSHGRKLADQAYADDAISSLEHAVLTGTQPAAGLASDPREAVVALVRLADRLVFPCDDAGQKRIRKALVEPSKSLLRSRHAEAREKVRCALLTVAVGGVDLPAAAMDTPAQKEVRSGLQTSDRPAAELIIVATSEQSGHEREAARTELAHLAVPGLVNGKVLLGSYGSTGDRRAVSTKLAAAKITDDGVALFVEAIDALGEVMLRRAGLPAPVRPGAREGRLRPVADGAVIVGGDPDKPADSPWFTGHWPEKTDTPGDDSGTPSEPSANERWAGLLQATDLVMKRARSAVAKVEGHFANLAALVGPGREMTAEEREAWQDQLDDLAKVVGTAGQKLRSLRYRVPADSSTTTHGTVDNFEFGIDDGEAAE